MSDWLAGNAQLQIRLVLNSLYTSRSFDCIYGNLHKNVQSLYFSDTDKRNENKNEYNNQYADYTKNNGRIMFKKKNNCFACWSKTRPQSACYEYTMHKMIWKYIRFILQATEVWFPASQSFMSLCNQASTNQSVYFHSVTIEWVPWGKKKKRWDWLFRSATCFYFSVYILGLCFQLDHAGLVYWHRSLQRAK